LPGTIANEHLSGHLADLEAAERLARREVELSEAVEAQQNLQRRFSAAVVLLQHQDADLEATTKRLTRREAELAEATETRLSLERQLAEAKSALGEVAKYDALNADLSATRQELARTDTMLREAEARHALAMTTAAKRLAQEEAKVREAQAALQAAEQRTAAERLATRLRTAERDAEIATQLHQEAATRQTLERALTVARNKVAETETAIRDAEHRHASQMTTATARIADQQTQYEVRLAEAAAARDLVDQRLREVEVSFERSREEAALGAAAAAERLVRLEAQRVEALANGQRLEGQLADANDALHVAEQRHASAMTSAAAQFAERQTEFETLLSQTSAVKDASDLRLREAEATLERIHNERAAEAIAVAKHLTHVESRLATSTANGQTLEQRLAEVTNALHTAEQLVVSERVASVERATEYETRLAEVSTAREMVSQQLHDTETTLARIRRESDANSIASAERLSQRESELATASADRQVLEGRLVDTETALKNAEARALAERRATIEQSAQRRAEFDAQLAREVEARNVVERDLAENRMAAEQTRQALLGRSATLTTEMRELEARLTQELARERADYERKLADLQVQLRALDVEREELRQSLDSSQAQLGSLSRVHEDANENFERIRQANEIEIQRLGAAYAVTHQTLDQVRADALQTLERLGSEHTAELVRINALVAERDAQLNYQAAGHAASQQAAQQALVGLENELHAAVTAHRQQVERLHSSLNAVIQDFDEMRRHRDALQIDADRVPQLTNQLEASRADSRRQFDESPIGILRCSGAGVLKDANGALIAALGYRGVDELSTLGSTDSVFESPDDFRWLIERCERTPSESVDCIWKKKNGRRLIMRLRAIRLSADVVDIVAEDVTAVRAVEERRRQSQRMEAVGRVASEVAITCENLLRNVSQEGQQWLATVGSNTAQRHHGELILSDVARAARFLRQLSLFGEKQTGALAGVDVNMVLRNLAPALKRVAGDDIELVLPKKAFALDVDVDAERVERVLVNIAAYGRARMPLGGRLIIKLDRVVVDRDFVRKYPNVRQGAHALISVAKVRTAPSAEWPTEPTAIGATSERPGIDLETLQALIGDCGGHLWMNAKPGGDMEVKIHFPLRSADRSLSAGAVRSALGRSVSTWFQRHT